MNGGPYQTIGRNAFFSFIKGVVAFPATLILVPLIIGSLGVEAYGVWALLQVMIGYVSLADLGMSTTITKYAAEYEAHGNRRAIQELFSTFFVLYSTLGASVCILVALTREWIIRTLFRGAGDGFQELPLLLVISTVVFAANLTFSVFLSLLNGLQRMDITNRIGIAIILSNFVGSVVFLRLGYRLSGLIAANAVASCIGVVLSVASVSRVAPWIRIAPHLFSWTAIRRVLSFNAYGAVGAVVSMIHFQIDKLFISYFLGLTLLAHYDVAHRLILLIWAGFGSMISPVMPMASRAYAALGMEKAREMFAKVFECVGIITIPVFMTTAAFAEVIIRAWLGGGNESTILALRFLSFTYLISILTAPGAAVLTGMGIPRFPFIGGIINSVLAVVLNLILVPAFQLQGVLVAGLVAYVLAATYLCYALSVVMERGILKKILPSAAARATVALVILVLLKGMASMVDAGWERLVLVLVGFPVLYGVWLVKSRRFDVVVEFLPPWLQFRGSGG